MELQGRIIAALEPRSGKSARTGNDWKLQSFVLETHESYPHKMVFEVFGDDRLQRFNIQVGDEVNVKFDIDAHEYQGRWFNSIRAYDVIHGDPAAAPQPTQAAPAGVTPQAAPAPAPVQPAAPAPADGGAEDDLPF